MICVFFAKMPVLMLQDIPIRIIVRLLGVGNTKDKAGSWEDENAR